MQGMLGIFISLDVAPMIDRHTDDRDNRRFVAQLKFALAQLGEAINRANEVMAEASAVLEKEAPVGIVRIYADENVPEVPRWDSETRTLSVGERIVKRFRVPSRNQETVLAAFEEEGWPRRIDDPLPYRTGLKAKYRLHFTIGRLNHSKREQVIRFFGDGTGEGVCWKFSDAGFNSIGTSAEGRDLGRRAA
jgi:hypothetical protein